MLRTLAEPTTTRSACAVQEIVTIEAFSALREEWNALLSRSDANCIFLTWEWMHAWWRHLGKGRKLSILAVRDAADLIGIGPFCGRPRNLLHGRPYEQIEFLGSGQVGSDYLDIIADSSCPAIVQKSLASYIAPLPVLLKLTQLRSFASCAADFAGFLEHTGWAITETKTSSCPFITLNGLDWNSYLSSLGVAHRYDVRRKWKRLERDFSVQFQRAETSHQCREMLDSLIQQHNSRWSNRGGSDAFHNAELLEFHREFIQIALRRGWLRLYVLRLDGAPAAHLYGFVYDRVFYFYQSGFDQAFGRYSVGLILMAKAIESAIGEGVSEFDLLHGTEAYKSHWSHERRDLVRFELFPPKRLARTYRAALATARNSRAAFDRGATGTGNHDS